MTDMSVLYAHVTALAKVSGKNGKESILDTISKIPGGAWLLDKVYNPFITYGVTNGTTHMGPGTEPFTVQYVGPLLEKLAKRELTGNAAKEAVETMISSLNFEGQWLLFWILKKDLQAGVNVTTVNKVVPGLLPVFSVARAHVYDEKKVKKWPVYGEPKLDGMRVTFLYKNGGGGFFSRTGNPLPALDHLVEDVMTTWRNFEANSGLNRGTEDLWDYLTDGNGEPSFALDAEVMTGLFASTGKVRGNDKADAAELHLFDILSFKDFDAVGEAGPDYEDRRENLKLFYSWVPAEVETMHVVPRIKLANDQEVQDQFSVCLNTPLAYYLARGNKQRQAELEKILIDEETGELKMLEGMIVKQPGGRYEKKKGYNWMKLKAEETEDLIVTGFFQGEQHGKNEHRMGGLIVNRNGVEVRVATGFKDKERDELWRAWTFDANQFGHFADVGFEGASFSPAQVVRGQKLANLALIGRMIEVKFHEVTPDGSLRHPRFVRFRDDKNGEVEDKAAAVAAIKKAQEPLPAGYGRF